MFGAIAGGIASALAGGAMSKLFGGGQKAASGGIQGDVLATDNNTVGMGDDIKKPPRFGGMKTYNWEGVNPDGYFLDKLEPIPSALPSFQKLFQVSATALSIP